MKRINILVLLFIMIFLVRADAAPSGKVIYETTSVYHHILVVDDAGTRTLSFDGSMETKMNLNNPLLGHFEYTEYFQMPWLWENHMKNVMVVGLGGGSTQRAYQYYYPGVMVDTVEIDPVVVQVAKKYFDVKESPTHKINVMDGRLFIRRSQKKYDAILMDAYTSNRYGSFIPYHLATKEFFQLASDHLTDDGVVAYNVIGTIYGWRSDIMGSLYRTMKQVFPNVYLFPARDSQNVVMIASKSKQKATTRWMRDECEKLIKSGQVKNPEFRAAMFAYTDVEPATANRSPILTDDYAPTDGLLRTGER